MNKFFKKVLRAISVLSVLIILVIGLVFTPSFSFAANSQATHNNYEYATVDTAPGASGYGTNEVKVRKKSSRQNQQVWFSIRGTGVMTVTLQFKCTGDSDYTDYEDYTGTERKVVDGGASGVVWRAIVKDGGHTSGSKTFGFDW